MRTLAAHHAVMGGVPLLAAFDRPRPIGVRADDDGQVTEWDQSFAYAALELGVGVEVRARRGGARPGDQPRQLAQARLLQDGELRRRGADAAEKLGEWLREYNAEPQNEVAGKAPAILLAEERQRLRPLKLQPRDLALRVPVLVGPRASVVYEGQSYAMPPEAVGLIRRVAPLRRSRRDSGRPLRDDAPAPSLDAGIRSPRGGGRGDPGRHEWWQRPPACPAPHRVGPDFDRAVHHGRQRVSRSRTKRNDEAQRRDRGRRCVGPGSQCLACERSPHWHAGCLVGRHGFKPCRLPLRLGADVSVPALVFIAALLFGCATPAPIIASIRGPRTSYGSAAARPFSRNGAASASRLRSSVNRVTPWHCGSRSRTEPSRGWRSARRRFGTRPVRRPRSKPAGHPRRWSIRRRCSPG